MRYQRVLNTLIPLSLIFGIFMNGVMADFCLCGQACLHGLQDKSAGKVNLPFHYRCCGAVCRSCNIETGQTIKAVNTIATTYNVKIFDITTIISVLVEYPSTIHRPKDFGFFYACGAVSSSQIYQQNLPLLC